MFRIQGLGFEVTMLRVQANFFCLWSPSTLELRLLLIPWQTANAWEHPHQPKVERVAQTLNPKP